MAHKCVRENLDSFLFLIVLDGKGSLDVKGKHYQVQKGSCALIDCMEHFEHISDEQDAWRLAWVHFNGRSARGYYELFMRYNKDENVFEVKDTQKWDDLLKELLNKQKERNLQSELYCAELIQHLLNMMIENVADLDTVASEEEKAIANEIREQVNVQYADAKVLEELEKCFSESITELSTKFRRYFGISLEEYISNRRFNAAKEFSVPYKGMDINVCVASGLANARTVMERVKNGEANYHLIEVMACRRGCIMGGGQPVRAGDRTKAARAKGLYNADNTMLIKKSDENPMVMELYQGLLKGKEHKLLHNEFY